jgi:putative transposase
MLLTERHIISKNHPFFKECDSICLKSKNLYNYALYLVRNKFIETSLLKEQGLLEKAVYLNYNSINRILINSKQVDYYNLPCKVSNQTLMLLDKNWLYFFKLIKDWKKNPSKYKGKPNLPKYLDKTKGRFITTFYKQSISKKLLKKGIVKLSKTNIEIESKKENIRQVRIVPKLDYYVIEIIYKKEEKPLLEDNDSYMSIDLGVNNLATVTSNKKEIVPFIINGKPLKSINQYYNKTLSLEKSSLKKRNNKGSSKKLRKLTTKRENKVNDYLHKSSRKIVNLVKENNVNTLIIGKNIHWKQEVSMKKSNNQNFVNIPHSRFIEMLSYKCELEGIRVILQEESYTSKASFLNLDFIPKYKPNSNKEYTFSGYRESRGMYKVKKENLRINADVNGSYNILRKAFPKAFDVDGIEGLSVNPIVINVGK